MKAYYEKMKIEQQFLQRSDEVLKMYEEMNNDGASSDEDNIIDDLQTKLTTNTVEK